EGVVAEEPADLIASALVEVDRSAPRRVVTLRKVGRKLVRVIPYRAEVVVDHVEDHSKVLGVAGIDEALESIGTAIGLERREEEDAVVAPAALSGELVDRHQFHVRDAEIDEVIEVLDRAVKRAFFAEGADVQLIENCG